jgi:hypothetical protein
MFPQTSSISSVQVLKFPLCNFVYPAVTASPLHPDVIFSSFFSQTLPSMYVFP